MRKFGNVRGIKGFVLGMLVMALLMTGITVFANAVTRQITVTYGHINLEIDGEQVLPRDVEGNIVEPFVYEGTTFLPVRAIADALGLDVDWDGATSTVILTTIVPEQEPTTPPPEPTTPAPTPPPTTPTPTTPTPTPPLAQTAQGLIGTWLWDAVGLPFYTFNADGTGTMAGDAIRWSRRSHHIFDGIISICSTPNICGANCVAPTEWFYILSENFLSLTSVANLDIYFMYRRAP
jgi:hypothetical protein